MKIETGVIAAAGSGTRMYPVALAYPKELLPIINVPSLHLVIEELIDSGLKRIIVITGSNAEPLHRQYDVSRFPARGTYEKLDQFVDKLAGIELIFKPQIGPYGNGTPLVVASPFISKDEWFTYSYGDDIIKSKIPFTRTLIEKHMRTGAVVVGTQEVNHEDVVLYGIVQLKEGCQDREILDVVEKPALEEARSNLAMFGRFVFSPEILRILTEIPLGKANELWLTDAVREYLRRGSRVVAESVKDGEWLTIGDPYNYLKTLLKYALSDPELRSTLEPLMRSLLDNKYS